EARIDVHDIPTLGHHSLPSAADAEQGADTEADDLIDEEEEQRGDGDHGEDEAGGHQRLLAGGPGDASHLRSDFADEFRRIKRHAIPLRTACLKSRRHDRLAPCWAPVSTPRVPTPPWQGWRVSNPQPPVLETGALAN